MSACTPTHISKVTALTFTRSRKGRCGQDSRAVSGQQVQGAACLVNADQSKACPVCALHWKRHTNLHRSTQMHGKIDSHADADTCYLERRKKRVRDSNEIISASHQGRQRRVKNGPIRPGLTESLVDLTILFLGNFPSGSPERHI